MLKAPNLIDYLNFLYQVVGVDPGNLPSAKGTATDGSLVFLQDVNQDWNPLQWAGYFCTDLATGEVGSIVTNDSSTLSFTPALNLPVSIGDSYLITQEVVIATLKQAQGTVNEALSCAAPSTFTRATYNLATHLLITYAPDQSGQTFWRDLRGKTGFNLSSPTLGVVSASSNDVSSMSYLNPEQFKHLTLRDLQLMKTPYGREYLGDAQDVGFEPFGMS